MVAGELKEHRRDKSSRAIEKEIVGGEKVREKEDGVLRARGMGGGATGGRV